jgi:hypothetical protein
MPNKGSIKYNKYSLTAKNLKVAKMVPRRNFRRKALKILSKVRLIPSTLKKMTISSPLVISVYNNIQAIFINSPSSV